MQAMKTTVAVVALTFFGLLFDCQCACAESSGGKVFNVRDAGAKGDGKTLDTKAIQQALDNCGDAGGGTVLFPPGTYLCQPIVMRTKTTLQLDKGATLLATDQRADYEREDKPNTFRPFLSGEDLEDVTIAGQGVIDGAGAAWWGDAEEARRKKPGYTLPRPNLIVLERATNLVVRDVTIQNSPKFHLVPTDCDGVTISGVTILAPEGAANTDAIDPSMCRHVTITKCLIDVGDDNIAIKAGKKAKGREFACEDIAVTDCTFKHGHGMSIGSETVGGVRNVRVKNCTFEDTDNGLRIKSDRTRGGRVEDIVYEDIRMTSVRGAITITGYYPKVPDKDDAQPVGATTPKYKNIVLRNVQGTSAQAAGVIVGLPESQIENVTLENVSIVAAKTGLEIRNARGVLAMGLSVVAKSGEAIIVRDAEVSGLKR